MKVVIDIPIEIKGKFDCAESNDLKGGYYDHGGVIGNAIKNGKPLRCVLDKIRREIKEYTFTAHGTKFIYIDRLNHILNKAESEDKE